MIRINKEISKEIKQKHDTNDSMYSKYATKNSDAIYEKNDEKHNFDLCGNFSKDVDNIINSKAYTRYMRKTQVFSHVNNDQITTRALHVQLVSKIARNIGKCLGLNLDLIEAISLAHDLGHTPYGHEGEDVLNKLIRKTGRCFKHGAHSIRILRDILHLNISIQTIDGILCHNGVLVKSNYKPNLKKEKSDVINDYNNCFKIDDYEKDLIPMTYEGCVARLSDRIAYIGRDIEDAITLKLMTRSEIPKDITSVLGNNNRDIVDSLISDIINNSYGKDTINFSTECYEAFMALRDFNFSRIYLNPLVKMDAMKRQNIIECMFYKYINDIKIGDKNSAIFKFILSNDKNYFKNTPTEIIVTDFIAGMTDDYLKREYTSYIMPASINTSFES